jgi:hypothetical protein
VLSNPYTTPETRDFRAEGGAVAQEIISVLLATRPWVRLMSVMMFIGAGVMLLAALAMLIAGGAALGMDDGDRVAGMTGGVAAALSVVYGLLGLLYIYPALKLWRYASGINVLARVQDSTSLHAALDEQRAFWKFIGIMILVILSLYLLIIVVALVGGLLAASS